MPNRRKPQPQISQPNYTSQKTQKVRAEISNPLARAPPSTSNNVRKKQREPPVEDDYTKLIRIESQVDSYIKRHIILANELDSVEENLREIEKEFNEEFDQLVLTSNQKHVLQTGDRVMKKLNEALHSNKVRPQSEPTPRKKVPNKSSTLPGSGKRPAPVTSTKSQSKPSTPVDEPQTLASNSGVNDLVHAQYAIIKTSTPNLDKPFNDNSATFPSENNNYYTQNNTGMVEDFSGLDETEWKFYEERITSPKMYLNMAMTMHSDNPTVEHCFRKIELLRPRILGYKSDHRYRVYHDLHNEIMILFYKLQNIDEDSKQLFDNDINVALCELHNLSGIMERSIDCQDIQCEICNSFNYRTEIQV